MWTEISSQALKVVFTIFFLSSRKSIFPAVIYVSQLYYSIQAITMAIYSSVRLICNLNEVLLGLYLEHIFKSF